MMRTIGPFPHVATARATGKTVDDVVTKMMDPEDLSDAEERKELEAEVDGMYGPSHSRRIERALDFSKVRISEEQSDEYEETESEEQTELEDFATTTEEEVDYDVDEIMEEQEEREDSPEVEADLTLVSQTAPESTALCASDSELEGETTLVSTPPRRSSSHKLIGSPTSVRKNPFKFAGSNEAVSMSIGMKGLDLTKGPEGKANGFALMPTPQSLPRKKTRDLVTGDDFAGLGKRKRDNLFA
ncbi:hypothetical protein BT69DRAFT_1030113 [Atractiella rhizophila]|nr:hypothetical protein BT69DRAFT_1030113 [Atractiella rhizophila]